MTLSTKAAALFTRIVTLAAILLLTLELATAWPCSPY